MSAAKPDWSWDKLRLAISARGLDRIAVGYAVGGWILVQVAAIALPSFEAPAWVLRALIIFILLGFPIAMTMVWFASPHIEAVAHGRSRLKRSHAAFGVVAAIVVFVAADLSYLVSRSGHAPTPEPPPSAQAALPPKNSIAVMPFVNMSGDPAKEYFSDGISEELLNDLANVPSLLVSARASSFSFKGKNADVKEIARLLGVRSVLEGSVRASGNQLRISAQLIDAAQGYYLWSAIYNRQLTDVLTVQDEIARAIADALTHKLIPVAVVRNSTNPKTIDPEAYREYLLAKHELAPRTREGAEAAAALFLDVTKRAPDFADGFAASARATIKLAEVHPDRSDLIPSAEAALKQALTLNPKNIDALSARLDLALHQPHWGTALDDARLMESISPNSYTVLHEMFRFYQYFGFPDLALQAAKAASKLDALSFVDRLNVAYALLHNGNWQEAAAAARAALTLQSDQPDALWVLCTASVQQSDLATSQAALAKLTSAHDDSNAQSCQFQIAAALHHGAEARKILDRLTQTLWPRDILAAQVGEYYAMIGDDRAALSWFDRSYQAHEWPLVVYPYEKIIPPAFFQDKGWTAFTRRPLFDEWRQAHDRIAAGLVAH